MISGPMQAGTLERAPLDRFIQLEPRGPLWTIYHRTDTATALFRVICREGGEECHVITRPNKTKYHAAHAQKTFSRNLATLHPNLAPIDIIGKDAIYFLPPRKRGLLTLADGAQEPLRDIEDDIFYDATSEERENSEEGPLHD